MTIRSALRPRTDADLATICTWAHSLEEAERWGGGGGDGAAFHLYLRCGFGWDGESRGYPRMALSLEP